MRKPFWNDLRNIGQNIKKPWLICGDFNIVLHPNDRAFGAPVTLAEIRDYSECIQDVKVGKLPWKGEYYTPTDKQIGDARICSRIDRAFGNYKWMIQWGHV